MVVLSFSIEKLLYRILTGTKRQSLRCNARDDEAGEGKPWKWDQVIKKFEAREQVMLNLYWKQRSPEGLKIGDVPLTNIRKFDMHAELTPQEAQKDGADTLAELEAFFQDTYGEGWRDLEWVKVEWETLPNANAAKPNRTNIDWFPELYSLNPLLFPKGCPYACSYCYARTMQARNLPNLKAGIYPGRIAGLQHVPANKPVFIESMGDLFHPSVPGALIRYVLEGLFAYNHGAFLYFLTKNPGRYASFLDCFDVHSMWLGTTIEALDYPAGVTSLAPSPRARLAALSQLKFPWKFVSVEPLMKMDPQKLAGSIAYAGAKLAFVGANTATAQVPEPGADDVATLIYHLKQHGVEVRQKGNLARLLNEPSEEPLPVETPALSAAPVIQKPVTPSGLDKWIRRAST